MSPRPRKVSDQDVFAAAYRAMSRLGPGDLTLAEIAAEAGVTAGALVQRFGSRRALLLALSAQAASSTTGFIEALAAKHASPLAALRAYADCLAGLAASPGALARNLAYLQIDLTDPDFRRHLLAQARETTTGLRALVTSAVEAGEFRRGTDPGRLVRAIETTLTGSMMRWAILQEGMAARWMRDDLDAVLAPYLKRKRRR
jgi:AcrR family transcriptional regulator